VLLLVVEKTGWPETSKRSERAFEHEAAGLAQRLHGPPPTFFLQSLAVFVAGSSSSSFLHNPDHLLKSSPARHAFLYSAGDSEYGPDQLFLF
jgi:hypothetical protein